MKISTKIGVAVLAAGLIATAVGVYKGRPQPASILDLTPIDDKHVLVVRRDARAGSPSAYFELVEARDKEVVVAWRRGVTGATVHADPWLRKANAVVAGDVYVARYVVSPLGPSAETAGSTRSPRLTGLRASDGTVLWEASPMAAEKDVRGDGFALLNLSLVAKGDLVVAFYGRDLGDAPWVRAIALDARTGAERWRADLKVTGGAGGPAWIRGDTLVVFTRPLLVAIDLKTGQERASFAVDERPCVGANAAWFTNGGSIRELGFSDFAVRELGALPERDLRLTGDCALRNGALWLVGTNTTTETSKPAGGVERHARASVLSLDARSGAARARIELGPVHIGAPDDKRTADESPDQSSLSGESTRFVPLIVGSAGERLRLVMLDLDEAKIAWQTTPSDRFTHSAVRRAGGRQFLTGATSSLIASFDGATGRLAGAIHGLRYDGPIFANGQLWLRDESIVMAAEPDTLTVMWSTGKNTTSDARADAEALFAPAPAVP